MIRYMMLLGFISCATSSTVGDTPCEELCVELVNQCAFSAYPDYNSCLEGCVYNETEEDQQTDEMLECVATASCNEFDILECEHQHGAESGD